MLTIFLKTEKLRISRYLRFTRIDSIISSKETENPFLKSKKFFHVCISAMKSQCTWIGNLKGR